MGSISGIGFGGLASGLDTKSLIRQLMALERRPLELLQRRDQLLGNQVTVLGELRNKLATLQSAAQALRNGSGFVAFKATVEPAGYFTASASSNAVAGSWQVAVNALAMAQSSASLGRVDKDVTHHGAGTLQVTVGSSQHDITIGTGNDTLAGIAQAINDAKVGVTASVVDTGQGPNPYKLVLTGDQPGTANSFSITTVGLSAPTLTALAAEIDANLVQPASDASLTVNGVPITRSNNTIDDAIQGVTLVLTAIHPSGASTVTVAADGGAVSAKVQKLVDAYNEVVAFFEKHGQVDENGKASSSLFGDATLRGIRAGLRDVLGRSVDTGSAAHALLSQVGIQADTQGKLSFDSQAFEAALTADPSSVQALFSKTGAGIAQVLNARLEAYTGSVDGIVESRTQGIEDRKRLLANQIRNQESRLAAVERQLVARFARLEELLARLQAQGRALGLG
jgi:flagellar hook-associated protein 2